MENKFTDAKDTKYFMTWAEVEARAKAFIFPKTSNKKVFGIPRGGNYIAAMLTPNAVEDPQKAEILVDDIIDSGRTYNHWHEQTGLEMVALVDKKNRPADRDLGWVVFPWEVNTAEEVGPSEAVVRLLEFIGEDPEREGLKQTPERVVRALQEMTSGYGVDVREILSKTFTQDCEDMIVVPGIRFSSLCEHHILPFFGQAHIAYIPRKKVLGVSKFARLVEVYAKRLQIQERMTRQIALDIEKATQAIGVGVVIKAHHTCMGSRGVKQPDAKMVTSVMLGAFRDKGPARSEFLSMVD